MRATPTSRPTKSSRVYADLRDEILAGRLAAGALVPPETQLARRFRTNRNTVREALRALESQNLIAVRQGARAVVRDFRREGELPLLPEFLATTTEPATWNDVLQEMLRLRTLLLVEAAGLAAARASSDDALALLQRAHAQQAHLHDPRATVRGDLAFFAALIAATHSLAITWTFNTLARLLARTVELLPDLWRVPAGYPAALERIASAIAARNPRRARNLLRRHLAAADRAILEALGATP
jgi:DNA-binding FadR family transcriptional regulator